MMAKRRRIVSTAVVSSDSSSEDDLEDMIDEGLDHEFLSRLNPESLKNVSKKSKTPVQRRGSSSEEEAFESVPRASQWSREEHHLLPLKTGRGQLIHQPPVERAQSSLVDIVITSPAAVSSGDEQGESPPAEATPTPSLSVAQLFVRRQEKLAARKERIAELASSLVEDPESNISNLKSLRELCSERDADVAISVRKLAIVSLTTVFKDIAPSYHIRELSREERSVKVRRDVRKLREFEESLLSNYQLFLALLDDSVRLCLGESPGASKRGRRGRPVEELDSGTTLSPQAVQVLGGVCLESLCRLLLALAHFNYRNNILAVLIPRMASRDHKISELCCQTIESLFKNDPVGEVSLEAVQMIAKLVKSKSYKTKPAVMDTLLSLRLSAIDEPVGGANTPAKNKKRDQSKLSKRQRKYLKEERVLERQLQEASALESRDKRSRLQTDMLRTIFTTYFRILKHSRHSPLLPSVLRGLSQFAHLISVDFFSDLMSVLHSLAESGGLSNRECMHCVSTAFEILSGQGSSLNIDPRQFYVRLYEGLLQLDSCSSGEDVLLVLSCLERLVGRRRQLPLHRIMAFIKRLSTVSVQLSPEAGLAVMAVIRSFMQTHPGTQRLLDAESAGGSVFRPDVSDPDMCHASSTQLWELSIYKRHYCEATRSYAEHLLAGSPDQGRRPADLLRERLGEMSAAPQPKKLKSGRYSVGELSPPMLELERAALEFSQLP